MTRDEALSAFQLASSIWHNSKDAGSESVAAAWFALLQGQDHTEVCEVIEEMSQTQGIDRLPEPRAILSAVTAKRRKALPAPERSSGMTYETWTRMRVQEAKDFAREYPGVMNAEQLARHIAMLETDNTQSFIGSARELAAEKKSAKRGPELAIMPTPEPRYDVMSICDEFETGQRTKEQMAALPEIVKAACKAELVRRKTTGVAK